MTYADSMNYQDGLGQLATAIDPQYMLTLAFNSTGATSLDYGADRVHKFHARLDRFTLGGRWRKCPNERRSHSLAIGQGHNYSVNVDSDYLYDYHFHMLLSPAPFPKMVLSFDEMEDLIHNIWVDLVPAGKSTDFQRVRETPDDAFNASAYCSRLMAAPGCPGIQYYCVN
jgi:hypothetical protein